MAKRILAGERTEKFTNAAGESLLLTFVEPKARVYRRVMQSSFRFVDGEMIADFGGAIDALMDVALESLIEAAGAEVEYEGIKYLIDSKLNIKHFNEVTGQKFASWKEALMENYPDFVRALAMYYYSRMSTSSGLPQVETETLEKN